MHFWLINHCTLIKCTSNAKLLGTMLKAEKMYRKKSNYQDHCTEHIIH